jgi:hypothetical protein
MFRQYRRQMIADEFFQSRIGHIARPALPQW